MLTCDWEICDFFPIILRKKNIYQENNHYCTLLIFSSALHVRARIGTNTTDLVKYFNTPGSKLFGMKEIHYPQFAGLKLWLF